MLQLSGMHQLLQRQGATPLGVPPVLHVVQELRAVLVQALKLLQRDASRCTLLTLQQAVLHLRVASPRCISALQ